MKMQARRMVDNLFESLKEVDDLPESLKLLIQYAGQKKGFHNSNTASITVKSFWQKTYQFSKK